MHRVLVVLTVSAILFLSSASLAEERERQNLASLMKPRSVEEVKATVPKDVTWIPDIAYREGHELWKLDLAMPAADSDTPRPAIVIVHGGGWSGGDKRANIWARYPIEYASRGFVAISINYRLLPDHPFPASIEDVRAAVRWLRASADKYNVDVNRIGAYGNSAGAHLALMLGLAGPEPRLDGTGPHTDHASRVQAVVASASPTDMSPWGARIMAGSQGDHELLTRLSSPIHHAAGDAPPILLIHGTNDATVPYEQPRRLMEALLAAGATDIAFKSYPGEGHNAYTQNLNETLPMSIGFFERTLAR